MIAGPRLSLTETKSSRKESIFPAEMPLIKLIGAANLQSPVIARKISALVPQEHQIRMRSDERDNECILVCFLET